jgi:hypothetical protein
MIWLTWRQLRTQAAVVFGGITVFAVLLAATGPRLAHRSHTGGDFLGETHGIDTALYVIGVVALLATPFVIGMFWGAPLVARELEAGTHRLAWTQTRTRTRWLVTKLTVLGVTAMVAAGLLSLAVTWWSAPIDRAIAATGGPVAPGLLVFPRLSPEIFDARGIAPVGYAALAFVLGVTVGTIIRRTLPAMAIVLTVFAVTQVVMSVAVRPHLMTPEHRTMPITATNLLRIDMAGDLTVAVDRPGAWGTAQHTVDAAGQAAHPPSWLADCPLPGPGQASQACFDRLTRLGYRQQVTYQPADRFWAFQRDETVIYLALTLLLAGLGTWWLRHRLS